VAKRKLLIIGYENNANEDGGSVVPLGDKRDVIKLLAQHNIAPDIPNGEFLYGPGITIQIPLTGNKDLTQILCSLRDEDVAWPVLMRLIPDTDWALMDPDSGRVLHLTSDPA